MAGVKKGNITRPPQWWKHLKDYKRVFWKKERKAVNKKIRTEGDESLVELDFIKSC